jgi:radical SAM protein with 4Fe4S-binding SPASM domain
MTTIEKKVRALESFIESKERLKKLRPLQYLFWEATLRCNLNCLHCGSDCTRDDSSQEHEISGEVIKHELCSLTNYFPPENCTFAIIGGEPLLRDEIIEVGAYAAELGYNWGITTNGMLLTPAMIARLKKAHLKTISISLDGIEADHDHLRRCIGSHKIVTTAIQNLLADPFFLKFDVICCVSTINIDHLEEFLDDLIKLRIPAVRFTPVFSRGRAGRNHELMMDSSGYLKLLNFIKQKRATQSEIKINLSEEGYWGPEWECLVRDDFHYCASGIQIGSILHDGSVTGCPSVSRNFLEGNIRESSFINIWKKAFSRYHEGRKEAFQSVCGECDHWILCEGGGYHLLDQSGTSKGNCCLDMILNHLSE